MEKSETPLEIRLNNRLFKCLIDEKFYNAADKQPFAVTFVMGAEPVSRQGANPRVGQPVPPPGVQEWAITASTAIVCKDCYEKMGFKDPSHVAKAQVDIRVTSQKQ